MDKYSDRQRLVSQPVFKEFLESNAPKLYKIILDSILSERHGEKRANLQEKRATALIWQLLYYRYSLVVGYTVTYVTNQMLMQIPQQAENIHIYNLLLFFYLPHKKLQNKIQQNINYFINQKFIPFK